MRSWWRRLAACLLCCGAAVAFSPVAASGEHNSGVAKITTTGQVTEYPLQKTETAVQLASGPDGYLWFSETESPRLSKLNPSTPEGASHSPEPGATIEYNVPLSGAGAPAQMTEGEVAKWGQKDDPIYATAIFSPDEPQGWPATSRRGRAHARNHLQRKHKRECDLALRWGWRGSGLDRRRLRGSGKMDA